MNDERKNIMNRGNLVVFSVSGAYRLGWVIGQENDGTYAILSESGVVYRHIFANKMNSRFSVNQKLTKQYLKSNNTVPHANLKLPDIAEILRDDTIEGWSASIIGVDYKSNIVVPDVSTDTDDELNDDIDMAMDNEINDYSVDDINDEND